MGQSGKVACRLCNPMPSIAITCVQMGELIQCSWMSGRALATLQVPCGSCPHDPHGDWLLDEIIANIAIETGHLVLTDPNGRLVKQRFVFTEGVDIDEVKEVDVSPSSVLASSLCPALLPPVSSSVSDELGEEYLPERDSIVKVWLPEMDDSMFREPDQIARSLNDMELSLGVWQKICAENPWVQLQDVPGDGLFPLCTLCRKWAHQLVHFRSAACRRRVRSSNGRFRVGPYLSAALHGTLGPDHSTSASCVDSPVVSLIESQASDGHGAVERQWLVETDAGYEVFCPGVVFRGSPPERFRYSRGAMTYEASILTDTAGVEKNLETGQLRKLRHRRVCPDTP